MADAIKISDEVTIGPQPSEEEIRRLAQQGFKTVVNFRPEGEEDQPLSPSAEGEKVLGAGMQYLHIPVSMNSMGPEVVDAFRSQYEALAKPVYAHCKGGTRAGAMVMMDTAIRQGMSGDQTLQKAEEMGFECKKEELRSFVKNYVDSH